MMSATLGSALTIGNGDDLAMNRRIRMLLFVALACGRMVHSPCGQAAQLDWIRQFGTTGEDLGFKSVSGDDLGYVFFSGKTSGSLGRPNLGLDDAFLSKFDVHGNRLWVRQFGSEGSDQANAVAADGLGGAYVVGLVSDKSFVSTKSFLFKYDANGNQTWSREIGLWGFSLVADSLGHLYVAGQTFESESYGDVAVAKYDSAGGLLWARHFGEPGTDVAYDISLDGLGGVYVAGRTEGSVGGANAGANDVFLAKFDGEGEQQWIRQYGTPDGEGNPRVSADALGNVYFSGSMQDGVFQSPRPHGFLLKYDSAGQQQWLRVIDTPGIDQLQDVWADGQGNAYVTGSTTGSLSAPNAGIHDIILAKFDSAGTVLSMNQLGMAHNDVGERVWGDGRGNLYVGGFTHNNLGGVLVGDRDFFLAKFVVPEPTGIPFVVVAAAMLRTRRDSRPSKRTLAWRTSHLFSAT